MDLQAYMDGMSKKWQRQRAESQMTLGAMIKALEAMPEGSLAPNIGQPHSYRGYYDDLAFESLGEGTRLAEELLKECRKSMGKVFSGYKGGDFVMGALTPVWISQYGATGVKLLCLYPNGTMKTEIDED